MKKLVSLFLTLALCLSLAPSALASIHEIYIIGPDGDESLSVSDVKGLSCEDSTTTLNGVSGISLSLGTSPTIVLAPGSKNTLFRLIGGDSDHVNDITIKGTGELILFDPNPDDFWKDLGTFSGLITSLKLEDGLTITGGLKEGDSEPLTVQPIKKDPVNGFVTYSCCLADKTPAQYVRIGPKQGAKPAEPEKPAPKPTTPTSTGFSDVPSNHYAADAIKNCVAKGITSGYSDGTFKPTAPVTRAQFCVMIARGFYPDRLKKNETAENKAKGWFVPAVLTLRDYALNMGILYGTSFREDCLSASVMSQPINRYDMAEMLFEVLLYDTDAENDPRKDTAKSKIGDWSKIPDNYQEAVSLCYALGIITGQSDGSFGGNNTMNRAQACVVIDRLSKLMETYTSTETPSTTPDKTPVEPPKTPDKTPDKTPVETPETPDKTPDKTPVETPETPDKTPTNPPAETPAPSGTDLESMRQGVLELVNAERSKAGKSPLSLNDALCDVAQLRADEIVKSFSHTRPNGSSCFTAIQEAGISYRALGENIAAGQNSPASVMNSWMNSDGHRANILSGDFTSIGIGYVKANSGYGHFWVQMFLG